jgi:uncharacterized membrane protein
METFEEHIAFVTKNAETIAYTLLGSIFFYMVCFWTLYMAITKWAESSVKANAKSTWKIYTDLD